MKIKKSELKQIIQEEIETVLTEKGKIKPQTPEHKAAIKKVDPEMPIDEPAAKFDWRAALSPMPHSQSPEAAAAQGAMSVLGIKTGPGQGDTAPPPKKRRDTAAPAVASATKSKDTGDDEETNESQDKLYQMVQEELEAVLAERNK